MPSHAKPLTLYVECWAFQPRLGVRERRESRVESEKGEGVKSNRKRRVESGQPRVKRSERSWRKVEVKKVKKGVGKWWKVEWKKLDLGGWGFKKKRKWESEKK